MYLTVADVYSNYQQLSLHKNSPGHISADTLSVGAVSPKTWSYAVTVE